ncbi:MAG: MerR family transcriptional regulator [Rhodovulum sp.]
MEKSPEAFRTISEVAAWLDTPAHVLRFWESRFTQVKPVKRAGGRRYYRPADMMLLGGIKKLLHEDGLTIRGVQKILREEGVKAVSALSPPLDDGGAGLLIEGEAERLEDGPPPALGAAESEPAEEMAPEAPMQEDAEAEIAEAEVVAFGQRPRPEPDEAMLPGLELEAPATQSDDAKAEAQPDEDPAPAPVPAFRRHSQPSEASPPPEEEPPVATAEAPPADDIAPSAPVDAPVPSEDALDEAVAEPQEAVEPVSAEDVAHEAVVEPQEANEPVLTAEPAAPAPLGADIARTDPSDDDPEFAPLATPLRTWVRSPALRKALAEDRQAATRVVSRLRALSERMQADEQGADSRG